MSSLSGHRIGALEVWLYSERLEALEGKALWSLMHTHVSLKPPPEPSWVMWGCDCGHQIPYVGQVDHS